MTYAVADLSHLEDLLERANRGCRESRAALIEMSWHRLRKLARRMLHFHYHRISRWEDTDDVLQLALLRLNRALSQTRPRSLREFYGLMARQIRWELIDLCRRHFGPQGIGFNHESNYGAEVAPESTGGTSLEDLDAPATLLEWSEFHEQVGGLSEEDREVFDLLWYQQLSQEDAAALLSVSVRTVKRRWQRVRLWLGRQMQGPPPI